MSDPAYQADDGARLRLFRRVLQALDMEDADQLLPDRAPDSDVPNTDVRSTDVRSTDVGSTDVGSRGLEGLSTRGVAALALLLAALRKQQ